MLSCDVCQKKFSQKGNLKTHIRIHTGEKPFKCDVCEKSFTHVGSLKAHMRIHTGEKPYSCNKCEKTFKQNGELSRHKRIHTGEKPYSCDLCQISFSTNSNLSRHYESDRHLKMLKFVGNTTSNSFVDCGEADIKLEIKEEETLDVDPFSINMEAEKVKETIKQEILEERIQDKDSLSCEKNTLKDSINRYCGSQD